MPKFKRFIVGVLTAEILLSSPALAATRSCTVTLSNVTVDHLGHVYVTGHDNGSNTPFAWQMVCGIVTPIQSVYTESCKTWVAAGLTAVSSGKEMIIFFDDLDMAGRTNCASLPSWNPFIIKYFGLNK